MIHECDFFSLSPRKIFQCEWNKKYSQQQQSGTKSDSQSIFMLLRRKFHIDFEIIVNQIHPHFTRKKLIPIEAIEGMALAFW